MRLRQDQFGIRAASIRARGWDRYRPAARPSRAYHFGVFITPEGGVIERAAMRDYERNA